MKPKTKTITLQVETTATHAQLRKAFLSCGTITAGGLRYLCSVVQVQVNDMTPVPKRKVKR